MLTAAGDRGATPPPSTSRRCGSSTPTPRAWRCATTASGSTWPWPSCSRLVRTTTVAQLLERDDFAKRYAARATRSRCSSCSTRCCRGTTRSRSRADVELGGTDQKFNLLLGREIQRAYGQPEQAILTMPLLVGVDGRRKMSKSLGNHIGVAEPARGDLRQDDEHPRRRRWATTTGCCSAASPPEGAGAARRQARARPGDRGVASHRPRPPARPRANWTASSSHRAPARGDRRGHVARARTASCTCRR